ncbi:MULTISPECIES: DUF6502 family protein [unclassified Oleiphilus]|jgi:hypothetical protein|nr:MULTISPECIES: DUF6502 family protein [unclassified Oleiphilus]KZY42408.1 hypothetical protein A3732_16345 [Oleiphilus sp. HI0050]KZY74391.1 hypothetical protein A3740_02755 [Oleiphilus sp. HI0068]KZY84183.1 hypothetical protein A3741_03280 [Oleiphilus sp. HI0069]KZY93669.1 hypothetical protein A3743_06140 [Oleiphilus sp. HI0072]KZZ10285.1 hypothetical protein A3749_11450 [Oleiphilus sp. HI0078]KZZ28106.1 hypothetical protein A3752_21840 [Oleiphilus sp. HI0081]
MNKETLSYKNTLSQCVIFMMKPLVRILLRSGVGFSDFAEWVKHAYVAVAEEEFTVDGKPQSTSRISILSGLHRKEVARIRKELDESKIPTTTTPANRAERVINAWLREPAYSRDQNAPLDLPFSSSNADTPSFESLVKEYSGDIHTTTLLEELTRLGAVEKLENEHLRLNQSGYIPIPESLDQIEVAAQSAHDLISTLSNNLNPDSDEPRFQRSVAYLHLSSDSIQEFKQYSKKENEKLLLKLNKWLAQHDMPLAEQKHASNQYRAGVGIYYFEELNNKSSQV